MAKNKKKLANLLGAEIVGRVPKVGGGGMGMARLAHLLHARLTPSQGERPGRPAVAGWVERPKVPMSPKTKAKLVHLAAQASKKGRRISAMQLAGQILEQAIEQMQDESA